MNFQPPDPVCMFCEDWCSGTCEGAREHAAPQKRVANLNKGCECPMDRVRWNTANGHSPQCNLARNAEHGGSQK
jgi:hypothetical protein